MVPVEVDDSGDDEDNDEESWSGTWDQHVKDVCKIMQVQKVLADVQSCDVVKHLISKNKDYLSCTSKSNKTLLHWTAYSGCVATTKLLLSRGAKKDSLDIWDRTPYDIAVSTGQIDELRKLLRPS